MPKHSSEIEMRILNIITRVQQNQADISKVIDDKISSLYKLTSITAFIVSTVVAIIGIGISTH